MHQTNCLTETPLATTFPNLFLCASNLDARVVDYMVRRGDSIMWGPIFRRNLNKMDTSQSRASMELLPRNGKGKRIWMPSTNSLFSVVSLFLAMTKSVAANNTNIAYLWKLKARPRVVAFGWMVVLVGILTMDNPRHHHVIVNNDFPMCLSDEESINNLLLNCNSAQFIWKKIFNWFYFSTPLPRSIPA